MSRTYKGTKGPGYEYWSRRPTNSTIPGRFAKKSTHKKERQQEEDQILQGVQEIFDEGLLEEETQEVYYDERKE